MPMTIRLTDKERVQIRKKCLEINKILIKRGLQPLKDSELIHKILEDSISYTEINEHGKIVVKK